MLLAVLGSRGLFANDARYALIACFVLPVAAHLPTYRLRPTRLIRLFTVGWVVGMTGSVIAFRSGSDDTWLQVFAGMSIAVVCAHSTVGRQPAGLREAIRLLAISTSVVSISSAVLWAAGLHRLSAISWMGHELAYLCVVGVATTFAVGWRNVAIANAASLVLGFAVYPAATVVLLVATGIAMFVGFGGSRLQRRLSLLLLAVAALAAIYSVVGSAGLATEYASAVGKGDNSAFRRDLWTTGITDFAESPIVGSMFSGRYTVDYSQGSGSMTYPVPTHNEYIALLRGGGLLGLLIAVPMIASILSKGTWSRRGEWPERRIELEVSALRTAAGAFLVSGLLNPVWSKAPVAVFGWLSVGILFSVASSRASRPVDSSSSPTSRGRHGFAAVPLMSSGLD